MTINDKNYTEILKQISGFKDLSEDDLSEFSLYINEVHYGPGTTLLEHHKKVENVSILIKGQVEVLVNNEIVALVDAINCFGEMSCLSGEENASATIRTTTNCQVLQISREEFLKFVYDHPKLYHGFFNLITSRMLKTNQRLSEVLNHTPQGLIKIDQLGMISNEYSKVCCEFFNEEKLSGLNFSKIIFPENIKAQKNWQEVLDNLFMGSKIMVPAALFSLLPQEISFKHKKGQKIYKLSYYRCLDQDQLIGIDIGIEDITNVKEFELKEKELEQEKEILKKIYEGPDSYMNLISLYEMNIREIESFISNFEQSISDDFEDACVKILRLLHNLKGTSSFYYLDNVSKQAHTLETFFQEIKKDGFCRSELKNQFIKEFRQFKEDLTKVKSYFEEIDPELKKRLLGIVIEQKQYLKLKQAIQEKRYQEVHNLIHELEMIPAHKLVKNWPHEIERLNKKLNKFASFEILDESTHLAPEIFNQLEPTFIHFLRNCMDHGIETLEERDQAGKEEEPQITFRTYKQDRDVVIEIEDNGRGIDYNVLKNKALENKNLDRDLINKIIKEDELWRLLFISGISSKEQVSEISGRGVGLESIYCALNALGGEINVTSEIGQGTTFRLKIPTTN